ncbi:MAG: PilZ domain-containing protein [Myxococcota bacterium]
MVSTHSRTEQRRSRRYRTPLVVDLHAAGRMQRHMATDVGRHGLFVVSADPPPERHIVKLTLHLPRGAVEATACVSRRLVAEGGREGGMGLQFFVISSDAKRRWDEFVSGLEGGAAVSGLPAPATDGEESLFFIKLKDETRLQEFYEKELEQGAMTLQTPVLRAVGTTVSLVVVHPLSSNEFTLRGMVAEVQAERPRSMRIVFDGLDDGRRRAFLRFMETGESPALPPPPPPPDVEPPVVHGMPEYELDLGDDDIIDVDERFSWEMANEPAVPVVMGQEILEELPALDPPHSSVDSLPPEIAAAVVPPLPEEPPLEEDAREPTDPPSTQIEDAEVVEATADTQPPPTAEETSTALTRLGISPGITVRLHCSTCRSADCTFPAGQPEGPLALFAERKAYWCPGCKVVASALTARSAYARRRAMEELGGPEGALLRSPVPLKFAFEVAALSATPTCPYCQGKLKITKQIKSLHKRVAVLLSQDPQEPLSVTRCPVCVTGKWMVQRAR